VKEKSKCCVCGKEFKNLFTHIRSMRDKDHREYDTIVLQTIHRLLSETEFDTKKISKIINNDFNINMLSKIRRIQQLEYRGKR